MESRAKLLGHAIHPMLVMFPLGLLITATFFDIAGMVSGYEAWHQAAFWMIGTGTVAGFVASVFGIVDWVAIPMGTRAKSVGLIHGVVNLAMLALFLIAWLLRRGQASVLDPGWIPIALQVIAVGMSGVGAWLGGELVERLGIGVDNGAHPNAPSSLSGRPADEREDGTNPVGRPVKARG
ncbi:MAG: DUF2231 domain-containing protein [Capsulimonadales bacterium]|nr:DUF2231 domain-containing protein [Capsulimonadales bacterium]